MAKDKICRPFVGIIAPENKFTVDTIDDLKSRNYLTIGDVVDLNGYYQAGDGSHHKRKIEETDDGSGVQLANGLWANIVHDGEVNVSWFGAKGDGVTDDGIYISKSLLVAGVVNLDKVKLISSKITLKSNTELKTKKTPITCSSQIVFDTEECAENISINDFYAIGDFGVFFEMLGSSITPINSNEYCKQIRLNGCYVNHTSKVNNADSTFIKMTNSIRQVFIDNCHAYTSNGILGNGKNVEVKISNSVIYGCGGSKETFGIYLKSEGETRFYNEGWHISSCTIDNFDKSTMIADIFVFECVNSYIGGVYPVFISNSGTTTHCREIKFSNTTFNGSVKVESRKESFLNFSDCTFLNFGFEATIGTSTIMLKDCSFQNGRSTVPYAIIARGDKIVVDGCYIDKSFQRGIISDSLTTNNTIINCIIKSDTEKYYVIGSNFVKNCTMNGTSKSLSGYMNFRYIYTKSFVSTDIIQTLTFDNLSENIPYILSGVLNINIEKDGYIMLKFSDNTKLFTSSGFSPVYYKVKAGANIPLILNTPFLTNGGVVTVDILSQESSGSINYHSFIYLNK